MQFILDFIDFLYNLITSIWDFVTGLFENLILLFEYLGIVSDICYSTISTMPDWLQAFGIITILISVLYMILGRSSGGTKE